MSVHLIGQGQVVIPTGSIIKEASLYLISKISFISSLSEPEFYDDILREINLAISDKAGFISDLLTEWNKFDFCKVGISAGVLETQNLIP